VTISSEPTNWLEFLSEASKRLSASLDYHATLDSVARLTVPTLADWCDIQMLDSAGVLRRVSMIHRDPAFVALAEENYRKHPYEQHQGEGVPMPLADGRAMLIPHVTDEMLAAYARHPDELATLRVFAPKSMILLPLIARQRKLGLMVLASAESGRIYDQSDLALAQELAVRAALAVDNARLYAAEQQARAEAEAALAARIEGQRQLQAILERFEKVFRASTIAICITRISDHTFVDGNPALTELLGYSIAEMRGKTGDELNLWVQSLDRAPMMQALFTVGSVSNLEVPMRDRAGRIHDTMMSLELIDYDGAKCILSLVHEVTEHKRLHERLGRAQKMEALGRLAGGIAHDFNNLLTAIGGYSSLVLEAVPPDSPVHDRVAHIERAAKRGAALTRQLLIFGRQQVQEPKVIDLNAAVGNLLTMLRRLIDEDVQLETTFDPDAGTVEIDPAQLEQVILNLALNARDAMPEGGRLHITTGHVCSGDDAPMVRLTVQDDGVGMDEATRARIFEPFFTTKEVGKGTGLGLATVYGIVEQAGGRIVVDSEPQRGARFDVLLPRSARAPSVAPSAAGKVIGRGDGQTLLVVEDDDSVREFVCCVLRSAGYAILTARDGDEAVRAAGAHPGQLDLLLTDIVMPNRNGRSLATELRRTNPGLRVMYMSGYPGDTLERYDGIPPGDAFLQKPFSREVLLEKMADALRLRG
jgi:PAS domain S-box-containing protein